MRERHQFPSWLNKDLIIQIKFIGWKRFAIRKFMNEQGLPFSEDDLKQAIPLIKVKSLDESYQFRVFSTSTIEIIYRGKRHQAHLNGNNQGVQEDINSDKVQQSGEDCSTRNNISI